MTNRFIALLILLSSTLVVNAQSYEESLKKGGVLMYEKDYSGAIELFNGLIESNDGDSIQRAWTYCYIGSCYNNLGDVDKTIENYSSAVKLGAPNPDAYSTLYKTAKTKKDYASQELALTKQLEVFPEYKDQIYNKLAYVYLNSKQFDKLLETTNHLTTVDPNNGKMLYFKGYAQYQTKDTNGAMETLKSAIEVDPSDMKSAQLLGTLQYQIAMNEYNKKKSKYESIKTPDRVDFSKYSKSLASTKVLYKDAIENLQKVYDAAPTDSVKKMLYNAYARVEDKANAAKYK